MLYVLHAEESEIDHNSHGTRLQELGSPAASQGRDCGAYNLGLGHFLSGPGFYFHTFPDTAGHMIKLKFSEAVFFLLTSEGCLKNILGDLGKIPSFLLSISFFATRKV